MYHEQTTRDIRRRRRRRMMAALVACLLVAAVRDTVLDAAMQCCAIEGAYPSSLDYLEREYGLRVNHDDYVITYEAFAGNVMPSVVVVPR